MEAHSLLIKQSGRYRCRCGTGVGACGEQLCADNKIVQADRFRTLSVLHLAVPGLKIEIKVAQGLNRAKVANCRA